MKTYKTVMVMIAAASILLPGVGAQAVDAKLYPGSMCVKYRGPEPIYNVSAIGNASSSDRMYLDCPAIKDETNINSAWLKAQDLHGTQAIECTLYSVYISGSSFYGWTQPDGTTGSGTTWQTLNYGGMSASGSGYYYFSCVIPPTYSGNASWIGNYYIAEN